MVAMTIQILIADDHQILVDGLLHLLKAQKDFRVVGTATDGQAAVRMAEELCPHVVVMDVSMPLLNGIDATSRILQKNPNIKIVALSSHRDDRLTTDIFAAGASAYVIKDSAFQELVAAIRAVSAGDTYISPKAKPSDWTPDIKAKSVYTMLSSREREVLQLIAEGKATKQVATSLQVSIKTAETHRRNLMEKLGLDSVALLTKYAIREGLTNAEA